MSDEDLRLPRYLSSYHHHADITSIDDFLRTMSASQVGDATSSEGKSLKSAIQILQNLKANYLGPPNDVTSRLLKKTVDIVLNVTKTMETLVEKTDSQGEEIKEQGNLRQKVEEIVKSDIKDQALEIQRLFETATLLEAKAVGYRGSHEALILRRALDDVRFAVADGFMLALPRFCRPELVNRYDLTQSSVIWWKFTDSISTAWWDFQRSEDMKDENDSTIGYESTQCKSIFQVRDLPWEADGRMKALVKEFTEGILSSDGYDYFTGEVYDVRGRLKNEHEIFEKGNETLLRQMRFFVPLLVWCFTSSKYNLISESNKIKSATDWIDYYGRLIERYQRGEGTAEELLESMSDPEDNQNLGERFVYGTGSNIRRQKHWRDVLELLFDGRDMGKKSQKRKSEDDGDASASQKPRIDLSTSTDSYAAEGLAKVYSTSLGEPESNQSAHSQEAPSIPSSSRVNPTVIQAWARKWDGYMSNLQQAQGSYEKWKARFNRMRKCLHILLSENLLRIAVTGPSALRNALDYLAHRCHPYDVDYFDAIERNEELLTSARVHFQNSDVRDLQDLPFNVKEEEKLGINCEKELQQAHEVLQDSDYIDHADATTEKAIDAFIEEQALNLESENGEASGVCTDYHILFHWLDSINPVPTNQESGTTDPEAEAKAA